jgi:prepilin-type N-terminal cleavage/methylation domain-containing protein
MAGFSLVELMVVLFILSTMLFVTIPHFRGSGISRSGNENQVLVALIQSLKRSAVKEGRDFFLHLDVVDGRAWASVEPGDQGTGDARASTADNRRADEDNGVLKSPLLTLPLKGVEIMNQSDLETTDAVIHFYSQGYSDMALIQMGEGDQAVTLRISPFLWDVEIVQGHGSFNDCI